MRTILLASIAAFGLAIAAPAFAARGQDQQILAAGDGHGGYQQTADAGDGHGGYQQTADGGDYVGNTQTAA